jgi:hypothetical protein
MVREIFADFNIESVKVSYSVSGTRSEAGKAARSKPASEVIIKNF